MFVRCCVPVSAVRGAEWKHEKEWRLVLVRQTGYLALPKGMVDGVILGMRTTQDIESSIRDWIGDRGTEVMRMQNREGTFELVSVPG